MAGEHRILLGRITKLHGFRGAVTVKVNRSHSENHPLPESVFLEIEGRPVPFFIEHTEPGDTGFMHIRFSGYDTAEKIREFVGCSVLIGEKDKWPADPDEEASLEGFMVVSEKGKTIGRVIEVIENKAQLLLKVTGKRGDEILIPLHDDLVIETDPAGKTIVIVIPGGLTGINKF
jgi:16S rRNA processing protein RimM